jgi:hypothetical protein
LLGRGLLIFISDVSIAGALAIAQVLRAKLCCPGLAATHTTLPGTSFHARVLHLAELLYGERPDSSDSF